MSFSFDVPSSVIHQTHVLLTCHAFYFLFFFESYRNFQPNEIFFGVRFYPYDLMTFKLYPFIDLNLHSNVGTLQQPMRRMGSLKQQLLYTNAWSLYIWELSIYYLLLQLKVLNSPLNFYLGPLLWTSNTLNFGNLLWSLHSYNQANVLLLDYNFDMFSSPGVIFERSSEKKADGKLLLCIVTYILFFLFLILLLHFI